MATLDTFGFTKGSRRAQPQQSTNSTTCAFVSPSNAIVKKPFSTFSSISTKQYQKKPAHNTITHYFAQKQQQQLIEEEEDVRCTIRQRIPMLQLWDKIKEEFTQDTYMQMNPVKLVAVAPSDDKKRRRTHAATVPTLKRQKTDLELSQVMAQFLSLSSKVKYHPFPQPNAFMKDYEEEVEEEEYLPRPLRHKMNIQHSSLYIYQITQEFLLLD
jgi:hypothetical protein